MRLLDTVNLALPNMVSLQTSRKMSFRKTEKKLLESSKENETALVTSPIFKKYSALYDSYSFLCAA